MLNDLRCAIRGLRRDVTFTVVAVVTLALGIGANTAVVALVRAVVLAPLPFGEAERLVAVSETRGSRRATALPVSGHEYAAWKEQSRVLDGAAIARATAANLTGAGEPETLTVFGVSADYFSVLRLQAALGRVFAPGEDRAGHDAVIVLADGFWRRRFGGNAGVVGRRLSIDGAPFTVIGIMPPLPSSLTPDAWLPLDVRAQVLAVGRHNLNVIARLRPGVTLAQARQDLEAISSRLARDRPDENADHHARVVPLRDELVGEFHAALLLLLGAVGFVLLIACANVANLLLARGSRRQQEIAVRTALGASRARLVRQLLVESCALASIGAVVGVLLAGWLIDLIPAIVAVRIPLIETTRLDRHALALATLVAALTGILTGLAPALRWSARDVRLHAAARVSGDPRGRRLRSLLVALEVALTHVLLVASGLMINSFVRLVLVNPGFDTAHVLVMGVDLPGTSYSGAPERRAFYDALRSRLRTMPGVVAAGATSHLPLGGSDNWMQFDIVGRPDRTPGQQLAAAVRVVTPDYFRVLGIPLRRWRLFDDRDARLSIPTIRWFRSNPFPRISTNRRRGQSP